MGLSPAVLERRVVWSTRVAIALGASAWLGNAHLLLNIAEVRFLAIPLLASVLQQSLK
jgi:hypothetical protein